MNNLTVFEIEHAGLADILDLGTGLAELRGLVPGSLARLPAERRERSLADLALLSVLVFHLKINHFIANSYIFSQIGMLIIELLSKNLSRNYFI